jgi:4-aminobutyrate aminotransferase-like enzyme/Ser/Thr protein kinase RdoA (MazF antagonist)
MDLLKHAPRFDCETAMSLTGKLYGIRARAVPLPSERDQNFLLTSESGENFVLKIANALEDRALLEAQNEAMTHLEKRLSLCPRVVPTLSCDQVSQIGSPTNTTHFIRLLTYLPGTPLAETRSYSPELLCDLGHKLGQLDRELAEFDHPAIHRDFHWDLANSSRIISEYGQTIQDLKLREMVYECAGNFERNASMLLAKLRQSVIHGDANDYNVLVSTGVDSESQHGTVVGLIDFGDMVHSYTVGELAVAIAYVLFDRADPMKAAVQVVAGYHKEYPLNQDEIEALHGLVIMRLCMSICLGANQQQQRPDNTYLRISQRSITDILPVVAAIDSRVAAELFRSACGFPARMALLPLGTSTKAETLAARRRLLGRNLSIAYKNPAKLVRGSMQYLYDDEDREYLDAYNNVAHVGHCHPRVVKAGQDQMALLNTNTRYLHDLINRFAERLTATLPAPLSVCFFVNSGSEANELALRLARAHTRARDLIVVEHCYLGNTTTLIDISPYKHDGPGGEGAPSWVHKVPLADVYRGLYRSDDPLAAKKYAEHVFRVIDQLRAREVGLTGFIAESLPSVGGQIVFPGGYLASVYEAVREAGGICIADEVQTGYGRIGSHFWGFENYSVVPDILVLGKPIGNGHPIGAVITTPQIAASFDNGMEFFSTFGGNTVSCAIGLAVLDVVLEDNLQEHALRVGERMIEGLYGLKDNHEIIGDVRGSGMFLGVELVRSRYGREPATGEAEMVVNRMREEGILLGTDGPFHNVIKIRPPMPFSLDDADRLIATLDGVLQSQSLLVTEF